jgi:phasin family protein
LQYDSEKRISYVTITQKRTASAQPAESSATKAAPMEATEKLVPITVDPIVSTTSAMSETIETTVDTVAAVAEALVKPIAATKMTTTKPLRGMNTMIKSTEDFVALGQANMEALVKSGQIWTAGVQELMTQFAETAKASFDESVAALTAISSAKSVTEAMDVQSKFATSVAGRALAESNKLVDASIKLTEKTLAPITARVTSAVKTFDKAA